MNVLMVIYKIERNSGSEDGVGYELSKILAQNIKNLTLITRSNNAAKLKDDPLFSTVEIIPIDVPYIFSFYKKKGRGIILYYYLWQIIVGIKLYFLQKKKHFDVIHHLNFHALWSAHFIFSKQAKIIWGPLTRHPSIPFDFWYESNFSFVLELIKRIIKNIFIYCDPFLRWAISRTDHIFLGQNDSPGPYQSSDKISLLPQAGNYYPIHFEKSLTKTFNILFIGRFISLKGCIIALNAVHRFLAKEEIDKKLVKVTFIGTGPLMPQLKQLAHASNIEIINWLPQNELQPYYQEASLFLFPSLEGQGLVVSEALSYGVPVLCIENTGPHTVADYASITVPMDKAAMVTKNLAHKLSCLSKEYWEFSDQYHDRIRLAFKRSKELSWDNKADIIMGYYRG
jgi:glycosyltransferase involved in cell wall biosynthesis